MIKLKAIIESIYDRSEMPQIHGSDVKTAFELLKSAKVPVKMIEVLPSKLKHSQKDVDREKVKRIIKSIKSGEPMSPIVISLGGWIVDGHHRQIANQVLNPKVPLKVLMIGLPRDRAIEAYKKIEEYLN